MREDGSPVMLVFLGGALVVMALIGSALKAIEIWFRQLGRTFDAFGNMAASGLSMLGHAALAAALIAAIVGSVIAAVYFTYKYIMLVKRATEIQALVDSRLHESACELREAFREFRTDVDGHIRRMESELAEALKEPDPVPILPAAKTETQDRPAPDAVTDPEEQDNLAVTHLAPDAEPPLSQPY